MIYLNFLHGSLLGRVYLIGTLGESMDKQKTRYKWCFEEKLR